MSGHKNRNKAFSALIHHLAKVKKLLETNSNRHFPTARKNPFNCIDHITTLFSYHWEHGTLTSSWKHANISLIPKPNKTLALEHLRPISLTSYL